MSDIYEKILTDLPAGCDTQCVTIDGERYVKLRTVFALFEHTEAGNRFWWWKYPKTRWLVKRGAGEHPGHWLKQVFDDAA